MKPSFVFALLAFSFIVPSLAFAEEGTAEVDVDGTTHTVSYDATGLTVDGVEADTSTETLTIFITTQDAEADLAITIERSFFDSQTDGEDDEFLVLADGLDIPYDESKTTTTRTLMFSVPAGTLSLDIISLGTTGFGGGEELPEVPEVPEEPPEEVPEEIPEEVQEEPQTQCGPGTILQDGVCVLEEPPEEVPEEIPEEVQEEPQTQCGPGTILKDGKCVLDERCGPGTVFKDGQCVLVETAAPSTPRSGGFELVAGIIAAFIIAFIVMIILWAIGRASRKKNNS